MSKIRIIFIGVILLFSVVAFLLFNSTQSPDTPTIAPISEFKVTQICGTGNAYYDNKPISRRMSASAIPLDIKKMKFKDEIYIMSDNHTSFEFYCCGVAFIALPGSYLYFHPKTMELRLYNGEFYWKKQIKDKKVEISIVEENQRGEQLPKIITLSDTGKLRNTASWLKIWNYSGLLKFNYGKDPYKLKSNSLLIARNNKRIRISALLHAPDSISPENKIVALDKSGDSIVRFNWKAVKGAQRYILRLYPSKLRETVLYEQETDSNKVILDLLKFDQYNEFYWQVSPYDFDSNSEGAPSKMGYLKVKGALFNAETTLNPPEIIIRTLDPSGNLVLIEGNTDKNAQLYINDIPITVNSEGAFVHTINFNEIGKKKIVFKAVSPSGIKSTVEKYVTTYDE